MGAKQRIMGACGCGEEEKSKEAAKKPWFKGTPADIKKAKEAGAVVVSGPCAKTAKPVDCPTKVKDGDSVYIEGCPDALEKAGVKAPKADATETATLEKENPAPEVVADAGAAEDAAAKPEDAAKPEAAAPAAEEPAKAEAK